MASFREIFDMISKSKHNINELEDKLELISKRTLYSEKLHLFHERLSGAMDFLVEVDNGILKVDGIQMSNSEHALYYICGKMRDEIRRQEINITIQKEGF